MPSVVFAVRGDQFNARRSFGGAVCGNFGSVSASQIVTPGSPPAGLIGASYIDMELAGASARSLFYSGLNLPLTQAMSIVMRTAFKENTLQGLWTFGGPTSSSAPYRTYIYYNAGSLNVLISKETGGTVASFSGTFTPTLGQFYDIVLTCTGLTAANGAKLYVDNSLIAQGTLSSVIASPRTAGLAGQLAIGGITFDVAGSSHWLNEFGVYDGVLDPANAPLESGTGALNGSARTSFLFAPALDGLAQSDPGLANVKLATVYTIGGVSLTGTYDGSDRWSDPGIANVRSTQSYKANSLVNNRTGTSVQPGTANVKTGIVFDNGSVGTYTGADRWSDPGAANVLSPTAYLANAIAQIGTLVVDFPDEGNVRQGILYAGGTKTGTYNLFSGQSTGGIGANDSALEGLSDFLRTNIPGLTVLTEWPYANQKLTYPSITITTGNPARMPLEPEQIAITTPDVDNKVTATEVVAEYDDTWQIDLWARNKLERAQVVKQIIDAFNAAEVDTTGANNPDGISLTLVNYFNVIARYEIQTHQSVDDEAAAQRQERREKFRVLVNFREVKQRTYYAMMNIETHLGVGPTDPSLDDLETHAVEID